MKKIRLLVVAVFSVVSLGAFAQIADLGKDWDGAGAFIEPVSGTAIAAGEFVYVINQGTENEVKFTAEGANVPGADNRSVYAQPMPSSISWIDLRNDNADFLEGAVAGAKKITAIKINGTSSSLGVLSNPGILYSDKTPFDESSIIGYDQLEFAACREGNAGTQLVASIPDGVKSFRVYRKITLSASGEKFVINPEGDILVALGTNNARVAYISVTLADGVPATAPTLAKTSGNDAQTVFVNQAISNIVYSYGGTATSATVAWTGGTPAGITVTPDAATKTVTISGAPSATGAYAYSVTATDGAATSEALTGTITATVPTKPLIAYVTNNANPTDEGDVAILAKLRETYDVNIVLSSATGVDYSSYVAVVMAALPGSGDAGMAELKGIAKPFVNLKPYQLQGSRWNWGVPANAEKVEEEIFSNVSVTDATHPIFAGMNLTDGATIELATASKHANGRILTPMNGWVGENESKAVTLATIVGSTYADAAVISEIVVGSVMDDAGAGNAAKPEGTTITEKYIQIGVSEQAAPYLTADFLTLVKNAVDYVIGDTGNSIDSEVADADKTPVATLLYDLSGRPVSNSASGFLIQKSIYEDGTSSYSKVYIRK